MKVPKARDQELASAIDDLGCREAGIGRLHGGDFVAVEHDRLMLAHPVDRVDDSNVRDRGTGGCGLAGRQHQQDRKVAAHHG